MKGRRVAFRGVSTPPFLELPAGTARVDVPTPRGQLAGLLAEPPAGPTGAPALLVPGFTGSKEDFLAVLAGLAGAGHRVLAVDQRGQFDSPGDDDPASYDIKALAEDLLAVVAHLGGPAHLVGHSFGGLVVRAAALADPATVRSVTLLSSGPAAIPHPASSNLLLLAQALPTTDLATIWAVKRQMELAGQPPPPPPIEDFLRRRFLANHPVALLRLTEQLLGEPDRVEELAGLGLPTLVAFGERDDAWPPSVQEDMARRLSAEVARIPAAAHSPAVENPRATTEALTGFWAATD